VKLSDRGRTQAVLTFEQEVIFVGMICGNSETNTRHLFTREGVSQNSEGRILNTQPLCTYQLRVRRLQPTDTFEAEPFASGFLACTLATMHFSH